MRDQTEQRMDEIMGRLLRTGVILAAAFVLAGGVVFLVRHPEPVTIIVCFRASRRSCARFPGFSMRRWRCVGEG